jgi:hypothetical protein
VKKILSLFLIFLLLSVPLYALAEGQEEELPYQEWIDKGWIKAVKPINDRGFTTISINVNKRACSLLY